MVANRSKRQPRRQGRKTETLEEQYERIEREAIEQAAERKQQARFTVPGKKSCLGV